MKIREIRRAGFFGIKKPAIKARAFAACGGGPYVFLME
jgi:hypothetical protein